MTTAAEETTAKPRVMKVLTFATQEESFERTRDTEGIPRSTQGSQEEYKRCKKRSRSRNNPKGVDEGLKNNSLMKAYETL